MTLSFAAPADAADAIIGQVLELRQDVWEKALAASEFKDTATFAGAEHVIRSAQEDAYLRSLGYILGADDEDAVDGYVEARIRQVVEAVDTALLVRISQMPTPGDLYDQRAEANALTILREAGPSGLSKTRLIPLLAADRLAFGRGEDSRWLKRWLTAGTVVERRLGRATTYIHRDAINSAAGERSPNTARP